MATQYSDLEDRNGEIRNKKTGRKYSSPTDLASDMGIDAATIQWGNIAKYTPPAATPAAPTGEQKPLAPVSGVVNGGIPVQQGAPQPATWIPEPGQPNPPSQPTQTAQGVSQWKNKWQNIKGITGFVRIGGAVYAVGPGGQPVGSEAELAWITEQTGKPLTANQVQKIPASKAAQYGIQLPGQPSITPSTIQSEETLTGEVVDSIPSELEDNEFFQQLDEDSQDIMKYYWNVLESQNEQKIEAFNEALDLAGEQAGPYWRERINILTDEISRSLGTLEADLESRESSLSKRIQRINEDLEYEREHLSVSEQAELKRIKGEYEVEIENTRSTMAERGLSSSTIRTKAEERMSTRQTDIVESTQRVYARAQRSLGLGSARSIEDIETEVEDLKRRTTEQKTAIGRKTEAYLGSEEAGKIPGLSDYLMGDISGSLVEDKSKDILARVKGLMSSNY